MGPAKHFFDVPVYRLPEEKYYADREADVEAAISSMFPSDREMEVMKRLPGRLDGLRDHLITAYGGCWRYIEAIGYVRLHFLGNQIRGEYYSIEAKRIVRTRRKLFKYQTWKLAPENSFSRDAGNQDIWKAIQDYVKDCRSELPKRILDTELLDAIGPFMDWKSFLDS